MAKTKREPSTKWMALLCLLTLVVFANTFGLGLALDGVGLVQGDPRVRAATAQNIAQIFQYDYWWPSSVDTLYRPLTTLSFLFNYAVLGNGDHAMGYHVVNVLLHMGNVLLVFVLAERLFGRPRPAFFAAAIWAVHPLVTESVANVAGRADLLAALFVLAGLLIYARARSGPLHLATLFLVALAGMFSKESAVVLIGLMLLWDLTFGGPRKLAAYGAVGAALVVMIAARYAVFRTAPVPEMPFVDNPLRGAGFWIARWTAVKMIGMDLGLLVWPRHLSAERGFDQITIAGAADPFAWLSLIVIVAILAAAIARYRQDKILFWAVGLFGVALLPVSNLVVLIGATMAERFLYLPSAGFAIAGVALLERVRARAPAEAILGVALVALAARTFVRNADWRDNLTLAQSDVESAPRSARMQEILASSLFAADPVRNLDRAIEAGERAWNILQVLPPARIYQQTPARLGAYYRLKGDAVGPPGNRAWYEKSVAILERARESSQAIERAYDAAQIGHGKPLATRVAYQPLYADLGLADMRLGRYADAIQAYRYGREVDPRTPQMYDLLAEAYAAEGDYRRAASTLLGKAQLLGAPAESLAQIQRIYGENSCAVTAGPGWMKLNDGCPAIQADLCAADGDLAELLRKARLPEPAAQFADRARQCSDK